ncbi:DUF6526 family protein [Algoriphagus confluentis]|uniref:PH domain-containing protein n=1 Tax=Algoriphagus confluentis TaxID=1697556 RepID=A0ABQ6PLX3_9BACT|nr:hypothetical protein Aconfl_11550 [Algoriphagus confluentis]
METQNYKNHTRYFPFHHFIVTPLSLLFFLWTILRVEFSSKGEIITSFYFLTGALLLVLLPLLARIYALKLQNRLILNEMSLRYFHLAGEPFYAKEKKLKLGQIIALRFASDEELLPLLEKAINLSLSPKEIKKSIKNWKGDYRRV